MKGPTRKNRSDSVLGSIPEDQQRHIIVWLGSMSYQDVLNQIARPAPEGLRLHVNYTTLGSANTTLLGSPRGISKTITASHLQHSKHLWGVR